MRWLRWGPCLAVNFSQQANSQALSILVQHTTRGFNNHSTSCTPLAQHTSPHPLPDALQVGAERFNLFKGCPKARTATMVLRGGSEQFIDEAERSLHDAIMIVRRALKNAAVVAGGGAIDMEVSRHA